MCVCLCMIMYVCVLFVCYEEQSRYSFFLFRLYRIELSIFIYIRYSIMFENRFSNLIVDIYILIGIKKCFIDSCRQLNINSIIATQCLTGETFLIFFFNLKLSFQNCQKILKTCFPVTTHAKINNCIQNLDLSTSQASGYTFYDSKLEDFNVSTIMYSVFQSMR